ncbi:MAG: hypothetical protein IJP68_01340, partial [Selenomonadaceae bacterium]|nr:hypothetical protein [Selenomonadaceae bacterium]
RDTISNFEFLTDSNLMTADKISVDSAVTNVVLKNSGDVIIQRGDDWITLEDAQGKQFKINDLVATVDKNALEFDGTTNYFLATSKRATLTVGEDVGDEAIIWLGNQRGSQFVGDFRNIDASNSTAKTELAGNDADNVICAGLGDASLWGGNGGDDLLIGGKAHNLFFYASGNGNDTIQSANDGDAVIFSEISIDQIIATNITADGTTINFTDGGSLNVATSNAVEFAFKDATYLADHSTGTWQQK